MQDMEIKEEYTMVQKENIGKKAFGLFLIATVLCGVIYTLLVTGIAQLLFHQKANGSIIEVDGIKYGSSLMGQHYEDEAHMWGRIMNLDVSTFTDEEGNALLYAGPSNLSPASKEYEELVSQRVEKIKQAHPKQKDVPIPVDLVTCSGSGLDPGISLAAAEYQISRIARANHMEESEVEAIMNSCIEKPFLGIFGEKTVNVLEFNLKLDGIIE